MEEKEMKKISDKKLDDVSGGAANGLFSVYSEEEYRLANVEVIGWGYFVNDGYAWKPTGEPINTHWANWAVNFYKRFGRAANSIEEVKHYEKKSQDDNFTLRE